MFFHLSSKQDFVIKFEKIMRSWIRSFFDVSADPEVVKARAARDEQIAAVKMLRAERDTLKVTVAENEVRGAKYTAAVQKRLNERAQAAEPALDAYDAVSVGKVLFDQSAQLVAKMYESIYNAAANEANSYGFRSKQLFSASIAADTLSRHFARWGAEPFDHLVLPLMQEMNDCGMDPAPVAPLLEFAHEGCVPAQRLDNAVLGLRENLARHRAAVGGVYSTGRPVNWESFLDGLKFKVKHLAETDGKPSSKHAHGDDELSLMEVADRQAQKIEDSVRSQRWPECVGSVQQLWTLLAPTLRGNAAQTSTTVPLLQSLFDIRAAAEQHVAANFYEDYAASQMARHQAAFTMRLFEIGEQYR